MDQTEKPGRCWYDPDGQEHPLGGKSHAEFAYEILLNQKIGEHMGKKIPTDGTTDQKGLSGEHAKAKAIEELGNPMATEHSERLREQGWVQASVLGDRLFIRSTSMDPVRMAWKSVSVVGQTFGSVVFAIGHSGSGVTAGLGGKDLALPVDLVIERIASAASGGNAIWPPRCHGVRYFE